MQSPRLMCIAWWGCNDVFDPVTLVLTRRQLIVYFACTRSLRLLDFGQGLNIWVDENNIF